MASNNYTEEQKVAVLARVPEIGVRAAAEEAGIPWQAVARWNKAAKEAQEPNSVEAEDAVVEAVSETAAEAPAVEAETVAEAPVAEAEPETATDEPVVEAEPEKKPTTAKAKPAEKKPAKPKQAAKKEAETVTTDQKVKSEKKMSEKKTRFPGMKPEWFEKMKNSKSKDEFKENMKTAWEKKTEMEKSSVEGAKKQWSQSQDHLKDLQEKFIDSLPDDAKFPVPSKNFMNEMRKFQETARTHFEEQVDAAVDFYFKGQEQFFDMVCKAMDKKKEK